MLPPKKAIGELIIFLTITPASNTVGTTPQDHERSYHYQSLQYLSSYDKAVVCLVPVIILLRKTGEIGEMEAMPHRRPEKRQATLFAQAKVVLQAPHA